MFTLNCKGRLLVIDRPLVMGILNITPDSFYKGSRTLLIEEAVEKARLMLDEGASILDLGGQSTRPGSQQVSADEEYDRVIPVVKAVAKAFPDAFISIDTFYARVLNGAVEAGACIANDVSGGMIDEHLLPAVAKLRIPYVLMHMKGHPQTMQDSPRYDDVVTGVFDELSFRIPHLLNLGINDVIVDPGFGFGKSIAHNFTLLKELSFFRKLGKPLMAGLSRKGTVYRTLGVPPTEALNGSTVLHTIALLNGADLLRVHDVKEAVEAVKLVQEYQK